MLIVGIIAVMMLLSGSDSSLVVVFVSSPIIFIIIANVAVSPHSGPGFAGSILGKTKLGSKTNKHITIHQQEYTEWHW